MEEETDTLENVFNVITDEHAFDDLMIDDLEEQPIVCDPLVAEPVDIIPRTNVRVIDPDEIGSHQVTFTITISIAVPTVKEEPKEEEDASAKKKDAKMVSKKDAKNEANKESKDNKSKKGAANTPQPSHYLHCEYLLFPGDVEPVRTDVVTYGSAAKIYTELQESKVVKTWTDGDVTWISWAHYHTVTVTESFLKSLVDHKVVISVWDDKEKVAPKVKLDKIKSLRLSEVVTECEVFGVEQQVSKQMKDYQRYQPKCPVPDVEPLPEPEPELPPPPPPPPVPAKGAKKKGGKDAKKKKVPTATLR